jgi:zinc/manganese transport system ATP-binding protein
LLPIFDSAIYLLDGRAHYAPIRDVVDGVLLTRLYGIPIQVAHTQEGEPFMRRAL